MSLAQAVWQQSHWLQVSELGTVTSGQEEKIKIYIPGSVIIFNLRSEGAIQNSLVGLGGQSNFLINFQVSQIHRNGISECHWNGQIWNIRCKLLLTLAKGEELDFFPAILLPSSQTASWCCRHLWMRTSSRSWAVTWKTLLTQAGTNMFKESCS